MKDRKLIPGPIIREPLARKVGNRVRGRFIETGRCSSCGIEIVEPPRDVQREQELKGDVIEHVYRHGAECAGGEHVVWDVSYLKPQQREN